MQSRMMMTTEAQPLLINMTPHAISIHATTDGTQNPYFVIPREVGCLPIRISEETVHFGNIGTIPLVRKTYSSSTEDIGLPDPRENVYLIVSDMVRRAFHGLRHDLISPDTGSGAVRDPNTGAIIGTTGFVIE